MRDRNFLKSPVFQARLEPSEPAMLEEGTGMMPLAHDYGFSSCCAGLCSVMNPSSHLFQTNFILISQADGDSLDGFRQCRQSFA